MIKGSSYNNKADCWAFGVVLFYMLTGHHPFGRDDHVEQQRIRNRSEGSSSFDFNSDQNSNNDNEPESPNQIAYGNSEISHDEKIASEIISDTSEPSWALLSFHS